MSEKKKYKSIEKYAPKREQFNPEYSSPMYAKDIMSPHKQDEELDKIIEAVRQENFVKPNIHQPELGTALDVIENTTKDKPVIWNDIPEDVRQRLASEKNLYPMPQARQIDPITQQILGTVSAPAQSFVYGIPQGLETIGEGLKNENKLTGFGQALTGGIHALLAGATPFNPVLAGFSIAGKTAEDIGAGGVFNTIMSPAQSILNPESEGGKVAAELADLAWNIALFHKLGKVGQRIREGRATIPPEIKPNIPPEIKPTEVKPTEPLQKEQPLAETQIEPKSRLEELQQRYNEIKDLKTKEAIREKRRLIKQINEENLKGGENATQERVVPESNLSEYQKTDARGLQTEAGNRNQPKPSEKIQAEEVKPVGEVKPETKEASTPIMITKRMERDLKSRGYSQEQIDRLTPQEAQNILSKSETNVEQPIEQAEFNQLVEESKKYKTAKEFIKEHSVHQQLLKSARQPLSPIGTKIRFIRFGEPVKKSKNWVNNEYLPGMSVYELGDSGASKTTIRGEFLDRNTAYVGEGKVVGYGSDGEPLVTDYTVRKATKKEIERADYYGLTRDEYLNAVKKSEAKLAEIWDYANKRGEEPSSQIKTEQPVETPKSIIESKGAKYEGRDKNGDITFTNPETGNKFKLNESDVVPATVERILKNDKKVEEVKPEVKVEPSTKQVSEEIKSEVKPELSKPRIDFESKKKEIESKRQEELRKLEQEAQSNKEIKYPETNKVEGYLAGQQGNTFSRVKDSPENSFFVIFDIKGDTAKYRINPNNREEAIANRVYTDKTADIVEGRYMTAKDVRDVEYGELVREGDSWRISKKLKVALIDPEGKAKAQQENIAKRKSEINAKYDKELESLQEEIAKQEEIRTKTKQEEPKQVSEEIKPEETVKPTKPIPQENIPKSPEIKSDKGKSETTIERLRREALDEFKRNQNLKSGFNPLDYKAQIKYGAVLIKEGIKNFTDWAKRMIKDFGENIRPYVRKIWNEIKSFGEDIAQMTFDKLNDFIESNYNPMRPFKIMPNEKFRQRFEGLKKTMEDVEKKGLDIPEETLKDVFNRKFFDALGRAETVIKEAEKIGKVDDYINFKLQAELYPGRAKNIIDKRYEYLTDKNEGFLRRLTDDGFEIDDLGEYMLARHAKERNAYIKEKYGKENGSGITDAEADRILKKWNGTGIDKYADEINEKIIKNTREELYKNGIISKELYDTLEGQYNYYVPLKGTIEAIETGSVGKGFSVETRGLKRAKGRSSISDNPFIRAILDANEATIRIEKNKVMQSFYNFVERFPSDAWEVSARRPFSSIGKDQLGVFIDGKQKVITVKDPALLRGLKNLGTERGFKLLDTVNSFLRSVNTYYNPEFIFTNFSRDAQTAITNIAGEKGIGVATKIVKDVPKLTKEIWSDIRGGTKSFWFEEYKKYGGKMSWLEYKTPDELATEFSKKVNSFQKRGSVKKAFIETEKFISDMNDMVENVFRVSAFKNLVELGISKEQAAIYAKDLTVNFNRKGEYGRVLNSIYLFSNAGLQGSKRIIRALKNPRTQKLVLGLAGLSTLTNFYNRMVDNEGYENIPDWEKDSNWIFMLGGNKYLKIRQPYGYNVFGVLGNVVGDFLHGKTDVIKLGGRLANATVDAFNPLGQAGSIAQFFAPTALDPIIQISENKKFSGSPVRKEQPQFQPKKPNSQLFLKSVRPLTKEVTTWLNEFTGGSEIESGWIDINPSDVDFVIDFLGGGAGKFIANTINTGTTLLTEGDLPDIKNIPFARTFIGESGEKNIVRNIYERFSESGRTRFTDEERRNFIKDVREAKKLKQIEPDEAQRLISTFISHQNILKRQK
jgi:hypothetical protein